jgi:hypothetical protein
MRHGLDNIQKGKWRFWSFLIAIRGPIYLEARMPETRTCRICCVEKDLGEFYIGSNALPLLDCKVCTSDAKCAMRALRKKEAVEARKQGPLPPSFFLHRGRIMGEQFVQIVRDFQIEKAKRRADRAEKVRADADTLERIRKLRAEAKAKEDYRREKRKQAREADRKYKSILRKTRSRERIAEREARGFPMKRAGDDDFGPVSGSIPRSKGTPPPLSAPKAPSYVPWSPSPRTTGGDA